ncbi:unnamed protein product [Sphagnum balticum]
MESFAHIVRRHANRLAISENLGEFDEEPTNVTYKELDGQAQAVGAALIERGIVQGSCVGIAIRKSADYIRALLGIWYAGAAFVPIDPTLPAERIRYICAEANIRILLINEKSALNSEDLEPVTCELVALTELAALKNLATLATLTALETKSNRSAKFPVHSGEDLAYVIFTSGSTGQPKGVEVLHKGICNVLNQQIKALRLDYQSRCLWYLSISFDASVSDLGTALLSGACLIIEAPCRLQPGAGLEEVFLNRQISYVDIPPSILRLLNPSTLAPHLKSIVIGGEKCAPEVVRSFASKVSLFNVYGPTEATICTSLGQCQNNWQKSLIGQPLNGIKYYVFDELMQPSPPGTPGQLYIGGIGLAKGYLNQPDLTNDKFIVSPDGSQRIYRTGDLVQITEHGEYEFLGRVDRQLKLRGMLIEPEEIESRLLESKLLKYASVIRRPVKEGATREILVAFIVINQNHKDETENSDVVKSLRHHLESCLPAWMVPQRFEILDQMPMTKSGKIDLSALRSVAMSSRSQSSLQAIDSSLYRILQNAFAQALGADNVGIDDNFFDIGGDSFAVLEATLIASALGVTLSPTLLMMHPTIRDLTERILHAQTSMESIADSGMSYAEIFEDISLNEETLDFIARRRDISLAQKNVPEQIFLTGASGFLGSRLLLELLKNTKATIHCLVRAKDNVQALTRIKQTLKKYGLDENQCWQRIIALSGDLELPFFGLKTDCFNSLANKIDTIFHCAAQINNLASYETLRGPNVGGTLEVIRLLGSGRAKCLHYASTLSVFVATNNNHGLLLETDNLQTTKTIYGGYAQTKFAAEILLRNLSGKLGPASYHRFGLITGDSQSGIGSDYDFLNLFLKGLRALNCAPEITEDICLDITPIDFAAKAMLQISLHCMQKQQFETYHIANSRSLSYSSLLLALQNYVDCQPNNTEQMQILPVPEFKKRLLERIGLLGTAESAACLALCRLTDADYSAFRTMDLFQATGVVFDMTNANKILEPMSLKCPPPSDVLINRYLKHLLPSKL